MLILYAVSGLSGVAAVLISMDKLIGGLVMLCVAIAILVLNMVFTSENVENKQHKEKNDGNTENQ